MVLTGNAETKDRTINIRLSSRDVDLIDQAAAIQKKSRSDFMLEVARSEAEDVLFDRNIFLLDDEAFDAYVAAIEFPVAPTAALRELMRTPAPWE